MSESKLYTSEEMRICADNCDASRINQCVSAMLRQAADELERIGKEIAKIDAMSVAPLDGYPLHQATNTEKVAAILEFFPKVKEILGDRNSHECDGRRKKNYEYALKWNDGEITRVSRDREDVEMRARRNAGMSKLVRRMVGEWEEC